MRLLILVVLLSGCLLPDGGPMDDTQAMERAIEHALRYGDSVTVVNGMGYERDVERGIDAGAPMDGRASSWTWHVCVDDRFMRVTVDVDGIDSTEATGLCRGMARQEVSSVQAAGILVQNQVQVPRDATRVAWLLAGDDGRPMWTLLVESPSREAAYQVDAIDGTYLGQSV